MFLTSDGKPQLAALGEGSHKVTLLCHTRFASGPKSHLGENFFCPILPHAPRNPAYCSLFMIETSFREQGLAGVPHASAALTVGHYCIITLSMSQGVTSLAICYCDLVP